MKKETEVYLLWNPISDDVKLRKTKPNASLPQTLIRKISMSAEMPELDVKETAVDFDMSEEKLRSFVAEELSDEDEPQDFDAGSFLYGYPLEKFKENTKLKLEEMESDRIKKGFLRELLYYEYSHMNRQKFLDFIEDKLLEVKG